MSNAADYTIFSLEFPRVKVIIEMIIIISLVFNAHKKNVDDGRRHDKNSRDYLRTNESNRTRNMREV